MVNIKTIKFIMLLFIVAIFFACKDKFEPKIDTPQTGYLVVEGFINSGLNAVTTIKLSRTSKLSEELIVPELKAEVQIIGENEAVYNLTEKGLGNYQSDALTLPAQKYQLKIITADGKEYLSSLLTNVKTPAIDSVSWKRENEGVKIMVNSHDDSNQIKFYKWNFVETWEIRSIIRSPLKYKETNIRNPKTNLPIIEVIPRSDQEIDKLYYCWKSNASKQILLGSTASLSKSIINYPIMSIPNGDEKLGVLYSIIVQQTALDLETYEFFKNLRDNTESNGSIFDRQPSETLGNIKCTSNPDEIVLGQVWLTSMEEQRIFIQIPWSYRFLCNPTIKAITNQVDTLEKYGQITTPIDPIYDPNDGQVIGYQVAFSRDCVDCSRRGSDIKPPFWP